MIREKLAERLKFFRERSSLTIYEVGEKVGKSGKTISAWENGRGQPDADMLLSLCDVYQIESIGELYGEKPPTSITQFPKIIDDMVSKYQSLNDVGRKKIDDYIDDLLQSGRYDKQVESDPVEKQSAKNTDPHIEKTVFQQAGAIMDALSNQVHTKK